MRVAPGLTLCGLTLILTGCDAEPAARSVRAGGSPAPALYQSLSGLVDQCKEASRRYDYAAASINETTTSKGITSATANEEERVCSQSANSMLKLQAVRLPVDEENAAFATAVEACMSEATDKASAGNTAKAHIGESKTATIVAEDRKHGEAAPNSSCATSLVAFANIARSIKK
jgi:hypothetical protein